MNLWINLNLFFYCYINEYKLRTMRVEREELIKLKINCQDNEKQYLDYAYNKLF